MNKRRSHQ